MDVRSAGGMLAGLRGISPGAAVWRSCTTVSDKRSFWPSRAVRIDTGRPDRRRQQFEQIRLRYEDELRSKIVNLL